MLSLSSLRLANKTHEKPRWKPQSKTYIKGAQTNMFAFIRMFALSLPLETWKRPNFVYNDLIKKRSHKRCHFKE